MIRAIHQPTPAGFERYATPGSFTLTPRSEAGLFEFRYFCPCGCGIVGTLLIGEGHKPQGRRPSWTWNGSRSEPTLTPSVHHVGHWHGWLKGGYWEVCA